ncbi:aminodeoxychorismate lyase apoprotein [Idiomarina loihiensis]|uniref:aminodeoxychorismate lyase n=1 Tax=Idiomarina TaxID=135575 RepID=UPI000D70B995|nr:MULTISPECIES: aminodeoxychorismate lyase [Idiomarina]PWW39221.1 aminodeoxychorismate lyase apoprotein [Idiomarina loihiensis]TDP49684.1 aminodeoxychorismate lyase apoprotein [Idiomarina loihiensis]TDS24002.1 aminodeoxychorismate lyase apoprotein [Idiomarina sp. H2]
MTIRKIQLNNKPFQFSEIDRGLQFGDGHFTTMRVVQGVPVHVERHLRRLSEANHRLFINHPDFDSLHQRILNACDGIEDGVCKVIITRGYGGRGYAFADGSIANEYIQVSDAPGRLSSVSLGVAELNLARQPRLAGLKTLNRLEQVLLTQECGASEYDDLLVCDSEGNIVEAIQGNVFWYKQGQWYTPDLSFAGVAGIIRQLIIDERALTPLNIGYFPLEELADVEQIILSNSVRGAVTVAQFNGKVLDKSKLPAVLEQLIL